MKTSKFEAVLKSITDRRRERGWYDTGLKRHPYKEKDLGQWEEETRNRCDRISTDNCNHNPVQFPDVEAERMRLLGIEVDADKRDALICRWAAQGVMVQADNGQPDRICDVAIPLSDKEWSDMLDIGGKYLEACCANISRARDLIGNARRNSGMIEAEQLREVAHLLSSHDDVRRMPAKHPVRRIVELEKRVRKELRVPGKPNASHLDKPLDCVGMVAKGMLELDMNDLFGNHGETPTLGMYRDEKCFKEALRIRQESIMRHNISRLEILARVIPPLKTLYEKILEIAPAPIDAYAVIRADGAIAETTFGYAIYMDIERCMEILNLWAESQEMEKARHREHKDGWNEGQKASMAKFLGRFHISKVRITAEKGLEVLERLV